MGIRGYMHTVIFNVEELKENKRIRRGIKDPET